ncbi:putative germin-like protein 2-1 [Phalaenopsis equestris]|uniref:putative germin-like protein 2-1 n=1 Tax=Phalaenopsis equestris TaxID=78828 RepID=UPI0009E478D0|nr:putative germin-like protein 2-1 [Phalaenopsis equestris]XP_020586482.1 putative germin-like protein 2-1 [Phalaenopsis equestris]
MALSHELQLLLIALLALPTSFVIATDPPQLQDFCVADINSNIILNGLVCKNPKLVSAKDFLFTGLNKPGNTTNQLGSKVTPVSATQLPGLNTLGISLARIDFAPYGLNPPHTHPRASEILVVIKGSLFVGFVTSNPDNKLYTEVLNEGDVFVFPQGLIHFQLNNGNGDAVAIAALSSQNPGVITIANAVFGSKPPIYRYVLERSFQLDEKTVEILQAKFWMNNN